MDEDILKLFDGAPDGGFADAIGLSDMGIGAIFAPVHQHHEQTVIQNEVGWASKRAQTIDEGLIHEGKDLPGDASKPFELFGSVISDILVEHTLPYDTKQTFDLTYKRGLIKAVLGPLLNNLINPVVEGLEGLDGDGI